LVEKEKIIAPNMASKLEVFPSFLIPPLAGPSA